MTTPSRKRNGLRLRFSRGDLLSSWLAFARRGFVGLFLVASVFGAEATRHFDLPAGDAEKALQRFHAQSGVEVLFSSETANGVRTNAVKGEFSPRKAIDLLLAGTSLVARLSGNSGAFIVSRKPVADAARESMPAEHQADSQKKKEPLRPRNQEPMNTHKPLPRLVAALGLLLAPATAVDAQNASSRGSSATSTAEEKAVELSPFVVQAADDDGYVAGNTLAGNRMSTPLKDTGASIGVLTEQFIKDIGANNAAEAIQWGNNVQMDMLDNQGFGAASPNDNGAFFNFSPTFRIRGISSTMTRNYFRWRMPSDGYIIERIEEARGPNSILFGIGSAGGIINSSTKRAQTTRNFNRFTAQYGSYDSVRETLDINRSLLDKKLGVRINGVHSDSGSWREHVFNRTKAIHVAATYNVLENTSVRGEFERGLLTGIAIRPVGSYDGVTRWLALGSPLIDAPITNATQMSALALGTYGPTTRVTVIENSNRILNLANTNLSEGFRSGNMISDRSIADDAINSGGIGGRRDGKYMTYSAYVTQKIGRTTFIELAFNHQEDASLTYFPSYNEATGTTLRADPNRFLPDGTPNPYAGRFYFDSSSGRLIARNRYDNTHLMASHELDLGKWGNYRVAGLGEYESRSEKLLIQWELWKDRPYSNTPEAAQNRVYRRYYATTGDWSTYHMGTPLSGLIENQVDPVTGRTLSSTWGNHNAGLSDTPSDLSYYLLTGQARYFKGRLVIGAGLRRDKLHRYVRNQRRDAATQEMIVDYQNGVESDYQGRTRTYGAVAHVTQNVSLFYNNSNSFALPATGVTLLPDGRLATNPVSIGKDMGVNLSFLDGKISLRATKYQVDLTNGAGSRFGGSTTGSPASVGNRILDALFANNLITRADYDAKRSLQTGSTFDQQLKGYELNITANITRNWRLQANWSQADGYDSNIAPEVKAWNAEYIPYFRSFDQSIVLNDGLTIAQELDTYLTNFNNGIATEGIAISGNRKFKAGGFTSYTFSKTFLKGLTIGGGYRHQSKNVVGRRDNNGPLLYGNSYGLADAMLRYHVQGVPFVDRWFKRGLDFQLNVSNVLGWEKPLITKRRNDDGSIFRWAVVDPTAFRLTVSGEF